MKCFIAIIVMSLGRTFGFKGLKYVRQNWIDRHTISASKLVIFTSNDSIRMIDK